MAKYHEVVYGNYPKSEYPRKLAWKLIWDYMKEGRRHSTVGTSDGDPILDVGCGDGTYVELFNRYGFSSFGIDSKVMLHMDAWNYPPFEACVVRSRCNCSDFNHDLLPYPNESFRYVFTKSVIEHVANTDHFLREVQRVLKPGGKVIILTPAWEYNYKDFFNDYTHVKPFHRKGLQDALKINDFKNVSVEYFYHLPWLWERPYLLPVAKALSLLSGWKWKDKEQTSHRVNIRFSQEVQLLAVGEK